MMISLERFLIESGLDGATIERWVARAWIAAPQAGHGEIPEADAARATFIRDLKADLGVNDEGVDVALHLVDQVHDLRRAPVTAARRADSRRPWRATALPGGGGSAVSAGRESRMGSL